MEDFPDLYSMEEGPLMNVPASAIQLFAITMLLDERYVQPFVKKRIEVDMLDWSYDRATQCIEWLEKQPHDDIRMTGGRGNQSTLDASIKKSVDNPKT